MGRCKSLFHPRNILLSYTQPKHFVTFEWGWPTIYLIWRIFWALYHLTLIILTGVYSWQWTTSKENELTWFIYLTHWAYFVLTVSGLMELAAVMHVNVNRPDILSGECKQMPVYLKAVWVMFNISNSAALTISILFWGLLYSATYPLTTIGVFTHALNTFYVLANLIVTALPVRVYHFVHPVIFSIIYVIFSVIYQKAGGLNGQDKPYIYSVMDWNNPETATLYSVIAALVLTPVCHLITFVIYLVRQAAFNTCLSRDNLDNIELEDTKPVQA